MNTFLKKSILYVFLLPMAPLFANIAYVGNSTDLAIIDTTTNLVTGSISLGTNPVLIAITPNNLYAYVPELNTDSVAVINTSTNAVATISLPSGSGPLGVAITPNGQFVYVTNEYSSTVSVISTATNQVVGTIPGFSEPWGIAITPDGHFAYVVNLNGGYSPGFISVIDLSSNTVLTSTIQVEAGPTGIAITPNGQFAYVPNENSNAVSVISIATNTVVATIPVGINPFEVATSPDSQFAYVTNSAYTQPSNGSISVISTATHTVTTTIPLDSNDPSGIAVSPDGTTLYVTTTTDVTTISTATNLVTGSIATGPRGSIAITGTLVANLAGQQLVNDFGMAYEYFNRLQWQSTPFSDVIGYNVYRNGSLIANVSSSTIQYDDHNQTPNLPVTYLVAPIEASGQEGTPLTIVVG